jgi:branched-subunit amino acid transport protein
MRGEVAIVIAGMAIIMYLTRAGGFWLVGRLTPTPRVTRIIEQLGGVTLVAAAVAALTAWRTGNLLIAMLLAMGVIRVLRQILA